MKTPEQLGLDKPSLKTPVGGWKDRTWYKVRVAFNKSNPIHTRLFFSGFIYEGIPASYNYFPDYEDRFKYFDAYYLNSIHEIWEEKDE